MTEHEGSEEGGEGRCGYTVIDLDGTEEPCDRPARHWRWYQDVGEHEDLLDVACDWHENDGGRRIHAAESARDTALREKADLDARLAAVEALEFSICDCREAFGHLTRCAWLKVRAALANPNAAQREAEVGARECRYPCGLPDEPPCGRRDERMPDALHLCSLDCPEPCPHVWYPSSLPAALRVLSYDSGRQREADAEVGWDWGPEQGAWLRALADALTTEEAEGAES